MKIPEFIPFHFDKFNSNLFKRQGAAGVGRWCMIRKAVAEMPQLYIDLNDPSDREGLELDTDSTPEQLTDMLDLAAQRGMIDANLYATGILWIENLETDLGRFYQTGKRNLPKKPTLHGKIPISGSHFKEKFHEVEATTVESSEKSGPLQGIPTHETKRNETKRNETHENARERPPDFDGQIWAKEFQDAYRLKAGKPRPMETAFAQCLIRMMFTKQFESYQDAFLMLKTRVASFNHYHETAGTETRFVPNPETWLDDDSWKIDWRQKAADYKKEDKTAKGGLQRGKSDTERIIEFNQNTGI